MGYFLAPSLVKLRDECNKRWPRRSKRSDGWIGDASHSARKSDHNPDYGAPGRRDGIVRAIDVTNDGISVNDLVREAIQDGRTYYVISRGFIYSVTCNWAKRRYNGVNGHYQHVHVSIRSTESAEFITRAWFAAQSVVDKIVGRRISASAVRTQFKRGKAGQSLTKSADVKAVQKLLNKKRNAQLKADGLAGTRTVRAFRIFEENNHFKHADGIPSTRGLVVLARRAVLPTKITK